MNALSLGILLLKSEHNGLRFARLQAVGGVDPATLEELRNDLAVIRACLTLLLAEHLDALSAALYSTLPSQEA